MKQGQNQRPSRCLDQSLEIKSES